MNWQVKRKTCSQLVDSFTRNRSASVNCVGKTSYTQVLELVKVITQELLLRKPPMKTEVRIYSRTTRAHKNLLLVFAQNVM